MRSAVSVFIPYLIFVGIFSVHAVSSLSGKVSGALMLGMIFSLFSFFSVIVFSARLGGMAQLFSSSSPVVTIPILLISSSVLISGIKFLLVPKDHNLSMISDIFGTWNPSLL